MLGSEARRRWALGFLFSFWVAAAPVYGITAGVCGVVVLDGAVNEPAADASFIPRTIVVDGLGDVVNRFYIPELIALKKELGSVPFRIVFADYSSPDESDLIPDAVSEQRAEHLVDVCGERAAAQLGHGGSQRFRRPPVLASRRWAGGAVV